MCRHHPLHCILPPNLLRRLLRHADPDVRAAAAETLAVDHRFRTPRAEPAAQRGGKAPQPVTFARIGGTVQRTVYDQRHSTAQRPGTVARVESRAPGARGAASQAAGGLGFTFYY